MNSVASILVHVDALPRSRMRLELAQTLAQRLDAAVQALYAVMPTVLEETTPFADNGVFMPGMLETDFQRRDLARALVDAAQGDGTHVRWAELSPLHALYPGFVHECFHHDLVVLGQYDGSDPAGAGVPPDFVPSVVVDSGKPVLVVPWAGDFDDVGHRVLIAWKPTREATRALSAVLPLLQPGATVHVAGWDCDPEEIRLFLLRHGIEATCSRERAAEVRVGEDVLSRAADLNADLLVMGCYGHTRARELLLGGATRTVLTSMTLPVLMAH
ncbi:universal stress protein [Azohydromonas lata]|uniref:Universal stress protein n=1 Tax=Azohydromonas lata TaxID=45677 RepID=A0ABU5ID80_9BURK|nr:universal stress protein [Azohydromonas lata]MDZ5456774.1 universal stress protein [Azohydromonas lata]